MWERPGGCSQNVRAILFEWVDGQPLTKIAMSSSIADQARTKLKALRGAGISHGDLAASNFLVQAQAPNLKVYLVDLSASITFPHIRISLQKLKEIQQKETHLLEAGFVLLSKIPINQGLCFAELSTANQASVDEILAVTVHTAPLGPTTAYLLATRGSENAVKRLSNPKTSPNPSSTRLRLTYRQLLYQKSKQSRRSVFVLSVAQPGPNFHGAGSDDRVRSLCLKVCVTCNPKHSHLA